VILYQRRFIRIAEYWNGEEPNFAGVDIERRFQQPRRIDGMFCRDFYTILIDLHNDPETLLAGMKRDTRYEIRRAQREGFVYNFRSGSDAASLKEFCDYHDEFALQRRQPRVRRPWLVLLADSGALNLTRIADPAGNTLVWHGYHCGRERATLLYSASLFRNREGSAQRNAAGRANRYQHWLDMLRFKDKGLSIYDLGGWYEGAEDQKRLRINQFKEEFGGRIVHNYICERASTFKGSLFLRIRKALLGNAI
jgi:hypothetical protein